MQQQLASYLQRGRQHAGAPTETLEDRWIVLMRQWLDAWSNDRWEYDHRERDDVEAELELRGVELPGELIPDVYSSFGELAQKGLMFAELRAMDPEVRERVDEQASEEFWRMLGGDGHDTQN
jgi:hypothetical protein